ncbi:HD-GYP domain-containing protein [Clostridium sp. A1-XYC3]|uniref:HD-GYP domain-containing protein n=1 Tax=Clostridium tanneri TaxID=3037988 RepID=A0ABU4JNW0_9CLOT|nr:HD-GYP domain-containing protein [Clostridium sp. A1-XYC3]MDW8799679.1 HD-GYP domain-containing protein [Clostridium sp. A1-XYC3]
MGKTKIYVSVQELKAGMISAQKIMFNNLILISPGLIFTESIIGKLKEKYLFDKVLIYSDQEVEESDLPKQKTVEEIEKSFQEFSDIVEDMFSTIENTNKANVDEIRLFGKKIQDELGPPSLVIKNIVLHGSGDDCIYRHSVNVAALSSMIGNWMGLDEKEVNLLTYAAILHDFGKTKIDKRILSKSDTLTRGEYELIKKHPIIGYEFAKNIPYLHQTVGYGIVMHHERLDGSGYPLRLKGNEIHLFAKIIAISDVFDAINSDRPYRKKMDPFSALETIRRESLGRLDYECCKMFIEHVANYYIGEKVLLSNNKVCKIVQVDFKNLSKPLLLSDSGFIDFKNEKGVSIERLML